MIFKLTHQMVFNAALLVSGLAAGGLVLSSCGEQTVSPPPMSQAGSQVECSPNISIVLNAATLADKSYDPNPITIARGATVTWTNNDTIPHTVTYRPGVDVSPTPTGEPADVNFDSGIIPPGGTFTHTFTDEGNFDYYCTIHPSMMGRVIVANSAGTCASPTPTESPGASPSVEPSPSPSVSITPTPSVAPSAEPSPVFTILSP